MDKLRLRSIPVYMFVAVSVFSIFLVVSNADSEANTTHGGEGKQNSTDGGKHFDYRCKCICPRINGTGRAVFIKNVTPDQCNCDHALLVELSKEGVPAIAAGEFCAKCQCKHESRNSWTIKFVVIGFILVTGLLLVYMCYFVLEAKFCKGSKSFSEDATVSYDQHFDDDTDFPAETSSQPYGLSLSLRNRFKQQMTNWKRSVMQQRGNVYVRRTVLNN